jgi:hypothetical protein
VFHHIALYGNMLNKSAVPRKCMSQWRYVILQNILRETHFSVKRQDATDRILQMNTTITHWTVEPTATHCMEIDERFM